MDKRRLAVCAALLVLAICLTALAPLISAGADGNAPVAENLELTTYRNVSVGGRLSAIDPDGDTLSFELTTEPAKGEVELTEDGRFVYTPNMNRRGRDYFGFKAVDSEGNCSQEATVIIKIVKQKTATSYSDMTGHESAWAATALAEAGIFTGERLGSLWVFYPDREVTRGEFLSMCMELSGARLLSGVATTGFLDDGDIPLWQKPYVATALMDGLVSGYSAGSGAVFDPNSPISRSEAAVMLDNVLELTDVSAARYDAEAPAWACQAAANLSACGILPSGSYSETLSRAAAAEMLAAAMSVQDAKR